MVRVMGQYQKIMILGNGVMATESPRIMLGWQKNLEM